MSKSLSRATLSRRSSLAQTAKNSQRFQEEVNGETNVNEMTPEMQKRIVYLRDEQLEDDPYNAEVYGDLDVQELSKAMNEYGFQGVILAYPIADGKYRIESGHRRRAAAKEAKIREYPVFITETPKTEYERRIRLFLGNLHSRDENPMTKARVAEGLYQAHRQEIRDRKNAGLLEEGENTLINDIVASDMEINKAHVGRLRALLKLNPQLQQLVATRTYSWTDLSAASTLSEEKQNELYQMIISRREKYGDDSVNRAFLQKTITGLKENNLSERKKARAKKCAERNYTKVIMYSSKNLMNALSAEVEYADADREKLQQTLRTLMECVENKLEQFNH